MARLYVQAQKFQIAGSGVSSSATSINLVSFKITKPDASTRDLTMADFGDLGLMVLEPGVSRKEETISFTGITQNGDGSATLTGVTRGITPFSPYGADSSYASAHSGFVTAILSNPAKMYSNLIGITDSPTLANLWTFSQSPIVPYPTLPSHAASKEYVDLVISAGGVDASTVIKGISKLTAASATSMGNIGVFTTLNTVTMTIATPAVATRIGHGLVLNDIIKFTTTGALPTGVTANTNYYVIATGLTADAFQFSATQGGAAINTSGGQSGIHTLYKLSTVSIGANANIYLTAHGFTVNDTITLQTTGSLPTGLATATTYYVLSAGLTTDSFRVSLTPGGTAVTTSGIQSGTHSLTRTTPYSVGNDDPRFVQFFAETGAADAYAITAIGVTSYINGARYFFRATNTNTTTSTLNINGLGAKPMYKINGATALVAGDIFAGMNVEVIYDSVSDSFRVLNPTAVTPSAVDIQIFTANGTWTKPSGAKFVDVYLLGGGGGGGGGGGVNTTSGQPGGGGGGGGSGSYSRKTFGAAALGATETITVGIAGTAGTAGPANTAGGNGGNGGLSKFGASSYITTGAGGGGGGGGGAGQAGAIGVAGTAGTAGVVGTGDFTGAGALGGTGNGGVGVDTATAFSPRSGGGGAQGSNGFAGGVGGGFITNFIKAGGTAGAAAVGGSAGGVGGAGNANSATLFYGGTGGGGGGGGGNGAGVGGGGAGGAAGNYGAGGGGGGGGGNSTGVKAGGDGGLGATGVVVVISYM